MFKPGLTRAIPASIIGAIVSAVLTLILRSVQNMDPLWDPTPAFVLMAIIVPTLFLWGMGGFNPAMSAHPHPPGDDDHDDHHDDHEEEPSTLATLMSQVWNVAGGAIILLVILFAFATSNIGIRLDIANEADASFSEVGFSEWTIPFTDTVVELSQLTVFMGFFGFMVLSLIAFAGGLGFLFFFLNRGVIETSEEG
ncbi:MAG: hypothetical protein ACPG7F_05030 [Aggregatilineales bacterium]